MSHNLFNTISQRPTSQQDLVLALQNCGALDCNILFVHSGLNFGTPRAPRTEILSAFVNSLCQHGPETICFPTFSFSFINNEVFDPSLTPGRMGALSEYFRKLPDVSRSLDPLMSVAARGANARQLTTTGTESCGRNSTFDQLSNRDGVKFLFLGVKPQDCFTYMHYLEYAAKVPYRYNRVFHGKIRSANNEYPAQATLFVRFPGVFPGPGNAAYEQQLVNDRITSQATFGDNFIYCIPEAPAKQLWFQLLNQNPNYFLKSPFVPPDSPTTDFEHVLPMVAM